MLQTVRGEKVDEKDGVICTVSTFPSFLKFNKILRSQILISPKHKVVVYNKQYNFLKVHYENFQMHICKLL